MSRRVMLTSFSMVMMFLCYTSNAQSTRASGGTTIGKIEVNPKWGSTPLVSVSNYSNSLRSSAGKWYIINISYYTASSTQGLKKTNWLDDVTMQVEMLFPAEYNRRKATAYMKGSVDYWAIPLDGKKHNAIMLVPPQVIKRYSREGENYKRSPIFIKVAFYDRNNRLIAPAGYYSSARNTEAQIRRAFDVAGGNRRISVAGLLNLGDVIMPRNKTPWMNIDYDKYEMIKPESAKR